MGQKQAKYFQNTWIWRQILAYLPSNYIDLEVLPEVGEFPFVYKQSFSYHILVSPIQLAGCTPNLEPKVSKLWKVNSKYFENQE